MLVSKEAKINLFRPIFFAVVAMAFFAFLLIGVVLVKAADTSKFKADYIISDALFTDYNSMSVTDIQNFLNARNSVCLKNFQTLSLVDQNNDGLGDEPYGKGVNEKVSAAKLIWQAAQLYKISPKVILVTLQKEQGLITTTDCPSWKYNTALGYGCPDSEPCDTSAYGFTRQIDYGVWHFRGFFDDDYPIPTYVPGNTDIAYNPSSSCGSKTINIKNRATAALYSYTPYQPNAATLAAAPGQEVSCGAYGNLNFWRYFSDWFGSPTTAYDVALVDTTLYSDPGRTLELPSTGDSYTVNMGQQVYARIVIQNIGSATLNQNTLRLGTASPFDRASRFYHPSWISGGRLAKPVETTITPTSNATFNFQLTIPRDIGKFVENFGVLVEGKQWLTTSGTLIPVKLDITPTVDYDATITSHELFINPQLTEPASSPTVLRLGQKLYGKTIIKNIGRATFSLSNTKLAPTSPHDRLDSAYHDSSWISLGRVSLVQASADIAPGQSGTFIYTIDNPGTPGNYYEQFGALVESAAWIDLEKATVQTTVDQYGYTLRSGEALFPGDQMHAGSYRLVFQGDGNLVIYNGDGTALWSSRTNGKGASRVVMQGDGNLVVYQYGGTYTWASMTSGK